MEAHKIPSGGSGGGGDDKPHPQPQRYQQYTYPYHHQPQPQPQPQQQQQQQYGTFQPSGPPLYPQPAIGFPQPSPPPGSAVPPLPPQYAAAAAGPGYYPQGYQAVSGYAVVAEGQPVRLHRNSVPFCGIGIGWILFIAGFFFAAIPWYVGALILLCVGVDHKEKPGLIACTIAALIAAVAILLGLTNGTAIW